MRHARSFDPWIRRTKNSHFETGCQDLAGEQFIRTHTTRSSNMKILPEKETVWSWLSKSVQTLWTIFEMPDTKDPVHHPPPSAWSSLECVVDENSVVRIKEDEKYLPDFHLIEEDDDNSSLPGLQSIDDTLN